MALALLEQHWPSCPALEDSIDTRGPVGLERDPRYLIGRFQQALTVLLEQDLPPMDAQTALLSQALADALAWRTRNPVKTSVTRALPTGRKLTATTNLLARWAP
jgi:hypothetical protein